MHAEAYAWIGMALDQLPLPARVVEFGSRNINGTARDFFGPATHYIGVDIMPGPGVDCVSDAVTFTPPIAPDVVICAETLEHAVNAVAIVRHAVEIVQPGGSVLVTCASPVRTPHSGFDGGALWPGEYYAGIEAVTVAAWGRDCGALVRAMMDDPDHGDAYVWLEKPA